MSRDHKTNSFCARRSIKALKFIYMCFFSTVWTLLEGAMWHYRRKTEHMEEGGGLSVLLWRREGARRWYPVTVSGSSQGCTGVGGCGGTRDMTCLPPSHIPPPPQNCVFHQVLRKISSLIDFLRQELYVHFTKHLHPRPLLRFGLACFWFDHWGCLSHRRKGLAHAGSWFMTEG